MVAGSSAPFPRRRLSTLLRAALVRSAPALQLHQIADRLGVCGEEEPVLVASCPPLGLHDVGEARYRDLHAVNPKDPSAAPDPLEVEPGHDEREIDVEAGAVRGADERLAADHTFREKAVPRSIERLGCAHEIETERFAGAPCDERLVGIGWQKKVTILGDEQRPGGPGIVVRAREPDDHEPDTVAAQPLDQARECVHQAQREARA